MKQFQVALLVLCDSSSITTQSTLADELNLTETDDTIRITLCGKPVLQYIKKSQPVPEGLPQNFRRSGYIHPNKPYFCFAPMVEGPFKIAPGKEYVSRHRYLVSSKAADVNMIQKHWDEYAELGESSDESR